MDSSEGISGGSNSVTIETLTFSGGTTINFDRNDVVVFVGPNNAGKSATLREIEQQIGRSRPGQVISGSTLRIVGTGDQLVEYLRGFSNARTKSGEPWLQGLRWEFSEAQLPSYWTDRLETLRVVFCQRVQTETRITDSDPVKAIATLSDNPTHPLHTLFVDDVTEARIAGYFKEAFHLDLALYRAGGSRWALFVGTKPEPTAGEHLYATSYNEKFVSSMVPLQEQGDGMRAFASVILHLLTPETPTVLLLDEPEAFLHPPQARLLGQLLANTRPRDRQLFVATHSSDVLQGLLGVASDHLRIIRVQRDGTVNRVRELDKARTQQIARDPLMKFSNVLSGVFYRRVIIGESDADCMFYSAILDLVEVRGDQQPDVLFIQAAGKARMAALVQALRALDVKVDVIADIDLLRDDGVLPRLVQSLGGDINEIASQLTALRKAVEEHSPWLTGKEVAEGVTEVLKQPAGVGEFPEAMKRQIKNLFRKGSPWEALKEAGMSATPGGEPTKHLNMIVEWLARLGLWIVPVGELEGFCKSVGGHGPRWVQEVLANKDLEADPELTSARAFVRRIWSGV